MGILRLGFYVCVVIFVAGCATAEGPIKAYDETTVVDKQSLAIIYLPPEIELLEVDGIETNTPYIEEGRNEVHITPGNHQLAVKYSSYWGDTSSGSMVRSAPVVLGINVSAKSIYSMKFKKPKDQWQAEHLANSFAPWLEDASGKKVEVINTLPGGNRLTGVNSSMGGNTPLQKLKFWWKNASFKDKKAFEKWMLEN